MLILTLSVPSVPVVSHMYIMDCVRGGQLLDRAAYMLPAGFSALLQKEVMEIRHKVEMY